MIVVRFVMKTQWGRTQEVVDRVKAELPRYKEVLGEERKIRLYTDLSGPFHTIVQEIEFESLAAWEAARAQMFSNPEAQEQNQPVESALVDGHVEYYTLEAAV